MWVFERNCNESSFSHWTRYCLQINFYLFVFNFRANNLFIKGVGDSSVKISNVLLTWTLKDLITMIIGLYVSTLGAKIYGANMKIFWFTSSLISAICGFQYYLLQCIHNIMVHY